MGHFNIFILALLVSSILPIGLAFPCNKTNGGPPSFSYSLLPTRTNVELPSSSLSTSVKPETETPFPSTPSNTGGGSTSSSDIQAFLDAHNTVRAKHSASPLVWSDSLSNKAQEWADNCQFVHSKGTLGDLGENLAAGTGIFKIPDAVKLWTDEVSSYDPNKPVPSHFTQVVWKSTTQLGCFVKICNNSNMFDLAKFGPTTFVVCEYSPPGNVIGQFSENVQV